MCYMIMAGIKKLINWIYRRYCTARLRRLYKSLKFTHGRGKYTKRAITPTTVTEVRCVYALTVCALY